MKEVTLDRYDINILTVLQNEGRISKRELASRINLSATPCWTRMHKLEKQGYIAGYSADINYDRLGQYCHFTTLVTLRSQNAIDVHRFQKAVMETPEIVECDAIMGEVDYILKFLVSSVDHYQEILDSLLESNVEIAGYRSHLRSKSIKRKSDSLILNLCDISNNTDPN
tara:strand:- start:3162 stop:3668 length:507 start_codon:yes stop_codon:yes gene_type:complete